MRFIMWCVCLSSFISVHYTLSNVLSSAADKELFNSDTISFAQTGCWCLLLLLLLPRNLINSFFFPRLIIPAVLSLSLTLPSYLDWNIFFFFYFSLCLWLIFCWDFSFLYIFCLLFFFPRYVSSFAQQNPVFYFSFYSLFASFFFYRERRKEDFRKKKKKGKIKIK